MKRQFRKMLEEYIKTLEMFINIAKLKGENPEPEDNFMIGVFKGMIQFEDDFKEWERKRAKEGKSTYYQEFVNESFNYRK